MLLLEAVERCQVHDTAIVRDKMQSLRMSMNLEMIRWSNLQINLWKIVYGTQLNLVTGQSVYTLDPTLITLTEMWYTTVNGNGTGQNSDRIMVPITRTQYAMIPNKLTPGIPTQFWFERLPVPQVTIWEPPSQGAPAYVLSYNWMQRIQDVNFASGETPDLVNRAYDAFCACLAYRIAPKIIPRSEWATALPPLKAMRDEAWEEWATNDNETGPMTIAPNLGGYARMT
jgi:hypothetical protein